MVERTEHTYLIEDDLEIDVANEILKTDVSVRAQTHETTVQINETAIELNESDEVDEDTSEVASNIFLSADPVKDYFRKTSRHKLLTAEEEVSLAKQIEIGLLAHEKIDQPEGDLSPSEIREYRVLLKMGEVATVKLVSSNTRLVISIAKRYTGRGLDFLDLIQEGNAGLLHALDKFDYKQGYKFSTYATWWIRQYVRRALDNDSRTIRIPVHMGESINAYARVSSQMLVELGRPATQQEMAKELDMTPAKIVEIQGYSRTVDSLNRTIGQDSDTEMGDLLEDTANPAPEDILDREMLSKSIQKTVQGLPTMEGLVISMRFGIDMERPMMLDEISAHFGITRERIRQIEQRAIKRLRLDADHSLKAFLGGL